ncbi:MAG TPA: hypothetical protein VK666_08610 [Chryseolinea sp.]|nr:hypothetical protein [Chryseolinea sp.]
MSTSSKDIPPHTKVMKRKTLLFMWISMILPFLLLFLIEILLRFVGYGYDLDLFVEYPADKNFLVFNPNASRRYFTNQDLATTGNTELFKKEKDPKTLRIFILGESTTIGYPYFHNGSFHRWIQYRLMNTFPDKKFEIINLSLTAVNSYTVLGFAKNLSEYKPDAVLIYSGHNEYYGTLGVASTENIGSDPWLINLVLQLRELRLVQWMTSAYSRIAPGNKRDPGTRMKLMVGQERIAFGSELYRSGIEQFEANMKKTVSIFNEKGIPVFISNLVSNEADMKPFIAEEVDSAQYPVFTSKYALAVKSLEKNDSSLAYGLFKEANKDYDRHALCNYYLGQLARREGDVAAARKYLSRAKDLDGLRFRAPSAINDVIAKLCQTYQNVHLVDTHAAFEQRSQDHIIGDDLMLEHVHPNLTGYAILSDAFYKAMKAFRIFDLTYENEMTFDQLLSSMPISSVDSLAGICKVTMLKQSWPFSEVLRRDTMITETKEEKLAWRLAKKEIVWQEAMDSLYTQYLAGNDLADAEKIIEAMVLEHPTDEVYYERAAMLNGKIGNKAKAIMYFEKTFDLLPTFEKAHYLFVLYLRLDKPFEALPYIDYGIKHNKSTFNLVQLKDQVEEIVRMKEALKSDSMNVKVINHIANAYVKMDNLDGANKYLKKVLHIDARNKEALSLSSDINRKLLRL